MTKKDYEVLAASVARMYFHSDEGGVDPTRGGTTKRYVAECLSADLKADNPRFNQDIFMRACGLS